MKSSSRREGQATVETRGFTGGACRAASQFLEEALGRRTAERLTAEFYLAQAAQQNQAAAQLTRCALGVGAFLLARWRFMAPAFVGAPVRTDVWRGRTVPLLSFQRALRVRRFAPQEILCHLLND